jgi:D-amino peptidase
MNIYVSVDMEGISGVCRESQVMGDGRDYGQGRKLYTWDVNACVDGCFKGGAKRVIVRDSHGGGENLIWEELDGRGEYVQGTTRERFPFLDDCDGLILLGYHAMATTREAIMEHTMTSKFWQRVWMNGKLCGETAIDAGIAGDHGLPLIMVSGDDKLCAEAKKLIPGIEAVQVKKGLGISGGLLLSRERAHELIRQGAARAVKLCGKIRPWKVKAPVRFRVELAGRRSASVPPRRGRLIDERTIEVTGPTVEEAFRML